jgi:microcystin-dependent protein
MGIKSRSSGANVGDIKPFAGAVVPAGWLECGGQAVSRVTYAALFLAIGATYGAGDGVNTFNVPDCRGRSLFGKDDMGGAAANRLTTGGGGVNGVALGAVGGGQSVTLTEAQMPAHTHQQNYGNASAGASGNVGALANGSGSIGATQSTVSKGSSGSHANIPPAIVTNYIIKA